MYSTACSILLRSIQQIAYGGSRAYLQISILGQTHLELHQQRSNSVFLDMVCKPWKVERKLIHEEYEKLAPLWLSYPWHSVLLELKHLTAPEEGKYNVAGSFLPCSAFPLLTLV